MRYFPIFLDLDGKTVLVAGGGSVAANKIRLFAKTGARIRCVALDYNEEILEFIASGRVEAIRAAPKETEFGDAFIVIAATKSEVDETIARRAQDEGLLVNAVDKTRFCTFITPSIVDRGSVAVAIGTEGAAPVLARRLREQVETLLPDNLGALADFIGGHRSLIKKTLPRAAARRSFWETIVDGEIGRLALSNRLGEAEEALKAALAKQVNLLVVKTLTRLTLVVSPWVPEDLTLKALRSLQDADVIVCDYGVPSIVLDRARRDAERNFIPKNEARLEQGVLDACQTALSEADGGRRIVCLLSPGTDPAAFSLFAQKLRAAGHDVDICAFVQSIDVECQ